MKKLVTGIFSVILLLGLNTGVMAKTEAISCTVKNFKEMLPVLKEMHPDLNTKKLKDLHKDCVAKMNKVSSASCPMNQN
jgi:hypothetical protein